MKDEDNNGTSAKEVDVSMTLPSQPSNSLKLPLQSSEKPQLYKISEVSFNAINAKKKLWKNIQAWYLVAVFYTTITIFQNGCFNSSSVIVFIRRISLNANNFFFAINTFLALILCSHAAYLLLARLSRKKNRWPAEKSSLNCYVFLTVYEFIAIFFVAIFCLTEENSFHWMSLQKLTQKGLENSMPLRQLHPVEMEEGCCGFSGAQDYFRHKEFLKIYNSTFLFSVPQSCCSQFPCTFFSEQVKSLTIHKKGCSKVINHYIQSYRVAISFSFFILALIQSFIVKLSFKVKKIYTQNNDGLNFVDQANHPAILPITDEYVTKI